MANTIRIKRSTGTTVLGSLANAELAYSEGSDKLYIGVGTGGAGGSATTVYQIASGELFKSQTTNKFYASPNGSTGAPTFRTIVAGDLPYHTHSGDQGSLSDTYSNFTATEVANAILDIDGILSNKSDSTHTHGNITSAGAIGSTANLPLITTTSGGITVGAFGSTANTFCQGNDSRLSDSRAPSGNAGGDLTGTYPSPTLTTTGVSDGTYTKVTVNTKGRVTSGASLSASDIPTLTASKVSDFDTQVRTSRLDQMAAPSNAVSMNSQKISSLADPTSAQDAATKAYVDAVKTGLDFKDSAKAATTANITLSGAQTIDGVGLTAGDRVLVKNQSTGSQNGIYVVASGSWTRATDFDANAEVTGGAFVFVEQGTVNGDSAWVLTNDGTATVGTTALTFTQFSGAGQVADGLGLSKTGNTLNVVPGTGITVANDDVSLDGQALALHNLSANGVIVRTGSGTVAARTISGTSGTVTVTDGNGVNGNPTISLDATLTALAALSTSANQVIYSTGADAFSMTGLTSFGRSLIDDADAATARSTLALGSMATQASNNVSISGGSIDGVTIDGGSW